jgi:subtilase family serine protease
MKVYRGDTLLHSGVNQSQAGEELTLENYFVSDGANCSNGGDAKNIRSDVQVKIGDGSWRTFDVVLTQPSTLTKGNPHKETSHYIIPEEAKGKMLEFRTKVDSSNDIKETNESNNTSDPNNERYPIVGNYNLIVANAGLTDSKTTVYQNSIGRVRYAISNIGTDTPLSSQGIRSTAEVKKPGESSYSLIAEDGSDSDQLSPGRLQEESTSQDGFSFNLAGTWSFRVTADCYNKLIENNETDNTYEFTVNVVPDNRRAIITITEARLKEGSSIKKSTRVHPICKVKNTGDAYPSGPLTIDYIIDKRRDGDTIQASELGPGVEKEEKVNNDNIKMGDKGNRTLTVTVKINGTEVARKNYSFKVK